jgi:hypothetical protein
VFSAVCSSGPVVTHSAYGNYTLPLQVPFSVGGWRHISCSGGSGELVKGGCCLASDYGIVRFYMLVCIYSRMMELNVENQFLYVIKFCPLTLFNLVSGGVQFQVKSNEDYTV